MKINVKILVLLSLFICCVKFQGYSQAKLISVPQQGPDTRLLKNNYTTWEKTLPFDGLSINFNSNDMNTSSSIGFYGRGGNELCYSVFNSKKSLIYSNYSNAINDLKNCNFQKLRNNFVTISIFNNNWAPWENDAAWEHQIANLEVAASIARNSGLKGIILDTETYGSAQNLNLLFYCQQFSNKILSQDSKQGYCRIKDVTDVNTIDDLFPKAQQTIYWKDVSDIVNGIRLKKASFNIYKDDNGNYYYPFLDPKYKDDVKNIIDKVEKRGQQIVAAVSKNFPNAEIMLTCGPSYVRDVLHNINGLTFNSNYLRTSYGLLIPFTKGLLEASTGTGIKLIDGQEQTYYDKNSADFARASKNFAGAGNYFTGDVRAKYLGNMRQAIGLFPRPTMSANSGNARLFSQNDIFNTFKIASANKGISYIWVYEEAESYWYLDSLKDRFITKAKTMSKIGGTNFNQHIQNISKGLKASQ